MRGGLRILTWGLLTALVTVTGSYGAGSRVPLSRVLLTETDVRTSIAKVALARYYLTRASRLPAGAEGDRRAAAERAAYNLRAAIFYLSSSLALSRGELRRDLEAVRDRLQEVEEGLGREPSRAQGALKPLEDRLGEILASIDRTSRTYRGSNGWVPSWVSPDSRNPLPGGAPSQQ